MGSGQIEMRAAETMELLETDGIWSCHMGLYHNGNRVILDAFAGDQLVLVLSGEADLAVEGRPIRLSAGGWINLPAGVGTVCQIYRSAEPVRLLLFRTPDGGRRVSMVGSLYDMPRYRDGRESLFAFDSRSVLGWACFGAAGDVCQWDEKGLLMCLKGSCRAVERDFHPYEQSLIPKDEKICFQENDSCVIIIASDGRQETAEEYKEWMFRTYGIQWDAGLRAM